MNSKKATSKASKKQQAGVKDVRIGNIVVKMYWSETCGYVTIPEN